MAQPTIVLTSKPGTQLKLTAIYGQIGENTPTI
jgi:hypothetical protein